MTPSVPRGTVLVATETFAAAVAEPQDLLQAEGFSIRLNTEHRPLTRDDYPRYLAGVQYVIAGLEPYDESVFAGYPEIRVLSRIGIGTDAIDFQAAKRHGIAVYNTPGAPSRSAAELAVAFMLGLARGIVDMTVDMRAGRWKPRLGFELEGKTLGLIGFGRVGKTVAGLTRTFGMRIVACDPIWDEHAARQFEVERVDQATLLKQADIVSLHLPLMPDTRYLINAEALDAMKRGAYLINTSRGGIVHAGALIDRLRSGRLAGAALDVFEHEPNVGEFQGVPNLLMSPHVGSNTAEGRYRMEMGAVKNLLAYVRAREAGLEPPRGLE